MVLCYLSFQNIDEQTNMTDISGRDIEALEIFMLAINLAFLHLEARNIHACAYIIHISHGFEGDIPEYQPRGDTKALALARYIWHPMPKA